MFVKVAQPDPYDGLAERGKKVYAAKQKALAEGHDPKAYALRMTKDGTKPWIGGCRLERNPKPLSVEAVMKAMRGK